MLAIVHGNANVYTWADPPNFMSNNWQLVKGMGNAKYARGAAVIQSIAS